MFCLDFLPPLYIIRSVLKKKKKENSHKGCAYLEEFNEMSREITTELEGTLEFYRFHSIILEFSVWDQHRRRELHKAAQLICDGIWPEFPASGYFTWPIVPPGCWIHHRYCSLKHRLLLVKVIFMWPKTWALAAIGEEEEEELSVLHLLSFKESRASRRKLLMFE